MTNGHSFHILKNSQLTDSAPEKQKLIFTSHYTQSSAVGWGSCTLKQTDNLVVIGHIFDIDFHHEDLLFISRSHRDSRSANLGINRLILTVSTVTHRMQRTKTPPFFLEVKRSKCLLKFLSFVRWLVRYLVEPANDPSHDRN